ncbi:hypothetical protein MSAN_00312300 [Mycena sanguinolenta]|uniref:Protein kinase domain-containing protein n=1 Tax=Mycena sanguinolenta TaxID=230812 RepID=A0A8H7DK72_9AGAR|nr:hypothetical protein MSAN_00312300 [Mycena sanguinolenta]
MRPTRVYQADKPNPRPILVETPLQPPMFSQSDAAAIQQSDRVSGTEHGRNGRRTFINYISGGRGGSGGGGGLRGGAGGPTLQYDMKAERIVVKNFTSPEATPSDFLRIPFGNIDLRSDIQVDAETGAVWRRHQWKSVRQMYSARVIGHNEPMTVALYEGDHAEEEWKRDLSCYSRLRHPHILQIYASASSSGIHAVVFHDELVLFSHFLEPFRYSAVLKVYIMACMIGMYNSGDVFDRTLHLTKSIKTTAVPWLAQANYILNRLKIVSNHEDYKYIEKVWFHLNIGRPTPNPPDGYLFICSPKDFETGPMSYQWPHRPAYWSLDSSGDNPLSHEDATSLGFPSIMLWTDVHVLSWDETVYAGLRKFDEGKGFNPESQDVAKGTRLSVV